jgi:DNA end-binding protein Ku
MRTLWRGHISFGLVTIPVRLYTATEHKDLKFSFLHAECKTPIRYQKYCPTCNRTVEMDEIVRGYEYESGQYVVMREEDFDQVPLTTTRSIDIVDFVNLVDIDPIYFDKTYYLEPGEGGAKAYALLKRAMGESGRIALAKVAIRSKETLAALRVYHDELLVMETMFWPDEIRAYAELKGYAEPERLHEKEIQMAEMLIGNLATDFDPTKYSDEYRQALLATIRARIEGEEVVRAAAPQPEKVIDLMEALRASVQLAEQQRANEAAAAAGRH